MAASKPQNPWGTMSGDKPISNKGFFNLDVESSPSKTRSFKEVLAGSGDSVPTLSQSTFNGVPAVLLSDEDVLKLASPFQYTLVDRLEPLPSSDNTEAKIVVSQENMQNPNDNISLEKEKNGIVENINEDADPKIFISVESILKEIGSSDNEHALLTNKEIVDKNSRSILKVTNREGELAGDGSDELYEEGEFLHPCNDEQNTEQMVQNIQNSVSNKLALSTVSTNDNSSKKNSEVASFSNTNTSNLQNIDDGGFSKVNQKKDGIISLFGSKCVNLLIMLVVRGALVETLILSLMLRKGEEEAELKVQELENVYMSNPSNDNLFSLNSAKDYLVSLQDQEEIFWKQKANVKFTVEGDRNTKFFHAMANRNRNRNYIHKIMINDGSFIDNEELICKSVVDHFKNNFQSTFNTNPLTNPHIIPKIVDDRDNELLCLIPSEEEIFNAANNLNGDSIAGPDGYTTKFFQKNVKKLAEFFGVNMNINDAKSISMMVIWRKPTVPYVKLNTDGSVKNCLAGTVGIIRDHDGKWFTNIVIVLGFILPAGRCHVVWVPNRDVDECQFQVDGNMEIMVKPGNIYTLLFGKLVIAVLGALKFARCGNPIATWESNFFCYCYRIKRSTQLKKLMNAYCDHSTQIIQGINSSTGAQIRILKNEYLPSCAISTDELIQIAGDASILKKTLFDGMRFMS
ncbi:hypothetical protein KFK09_002630 [Dendrobium nobile]|uniref:Uncharacterized protein n=1 Tax=Dendrobium nobile TaxID=94219 RepID=A0A8T3C274_DENNO|nr:hypothetical protein KFK09_002630 [Dendrobium nobile]